MLGRPGITKPLITQVKIITKESCDLQATQAENGNQKVSNNNIIIMFNHVFAVLRARVERETKMDASSTDSATSGTETGGSDTETMSESEWNLPGGREAVAATVPKRRAVNGPQLTSYRGTTATPRARNLPAGIKPKELRKINMNPRDNAKVPKRVATMEQLASGRTIPEVLGSLRPVARSKVNRLRIRHNPGPDIRSLLKSMQKLHEPAGQKKKPKGSINVPKARKSPKKKTTTKKSAGSAFSMRKRFTLTDTESEDEGARLQAAQAKNRQAATDTNIIVDVNSNNIAKTAPGGLRSHQTMEGYKIPRVNLNKNPTQSTPSSKTSALSSNSSQGKDQAQDHHLQGQVAVQAEEVKRIIINKAKDSVQGDKASIKKPVSLFRPWAEDSAKPDPVCEEIPDHEDQEDKDSLISFESNTDSGIGMSDVGKKRTNQGTAKINSQIYFTHDQKALSGSQKPSSYACTCRGNGSPATNCLTDKNHSLYGSIYFAAMDTDVAAKSLRSAVSDAFHARVDETRAKAGKEAKPNFDAANYEEEDLDGGTIKASSGPVPCGPKQPSEVPLLSLRDLMPEGAQQTDPDDRSLDIKFKADKVEFLLVSRPALAQEISSGMVMQEVSEVEWEIPTPEEYFEVIGKITDMYTDKDKTFIHGLSWSSVGSLTGTGIFTIKTGSMDHIHGFRSMLRDYINKGRCFESFPKQALMNKFSLTLYIPPSIRHVDTKKVLTWLMDLNRGLRGEISPVSVKKLRDTHPLERRRGARIVSFTGNQEFLDSLHQFPREYPFDVKVGNLYIRGGERTEVEYTRQRRSKRPKMTQEALQTLLKRNSGGIANEAEEAEDKLAGLNISGSNPK
jgi:hypothetical protein